MKKIVLALAVVFSVAMVSCSGNKAAEENADTANVEAVEVSETEVVEAPADSAAAPADSAAAAETPAEAPATEAAAQ